MFIFIKFLGGIDFMKTLKKFTAAMILIALFAVPSFALDTTNALTQRPENSIYGLIKLQNLSGFVSWLLSRENLNIAAKFAGNDTLDAETIDLIWRSITLKVFPPSRSSRVSP